MYSKKKVRFRLRRVHRQLLRISEIIKNYEWAMISAANDSVLIITYTTVNKHSLAIDNTLIGSPTNLSVRPIRTV